MNYETLPNIVDYGGILYVTFPRDPLPYLLDSIPKNHRLLSSYPWQSRRGSLVYFCGTHNGTRSYTHYKFLLLEMDPNTMPDSWISIKHRNTNTRDLRLHNLILYSCDTYQRSIHLFTPDGAPPYAATWCSFDGESIFINTETIIDRPSSRFTVSMICDNTPETRALLQKTRWTVHQGDVIDMENADCDDITDRYFVSQLTGVPYHCITFISGVRTDCRVLNLFINQSMVRAWERQAYDLIRLRTWTPQSFPSPLLLPSSASSCSSSPLLLPELDQLTMKDTEEECCR